MDLLLKEFQDDLERVKKLLVFIKTLQTYAGTTPSAGATAETHNVHTQSVACHADLTILVGTMILYLGGRFEHFVRTEFEEMCDTIAVRCNSYDRLPKEMRQTLIVRTAEVMSNPRKYGHADKGVEAFIKNLAENMNDRTQLRAINSACLSITYETCAQLSCKICSIGSAPRNCGSPSANRPLLNFCLRRATVLTPRTRHNHS